MVFAIQRNAEPGQLQGVDILTLRDDLQSEMLIVEEDLKKWLAEQMRAITSAHAMDESPPKRRTQEPPMEVIKYA